MRPAAKIRTLKRLHTKSYDIPYGPDQLADQKTYVSLLLHYSFELAVFTFQKYEIMKMRISESSYLIRIRKVPGLKLGPEPTILSLFRGFP
jgi:hypothetical protein